MTNYPSVFSPAVLFRSVLDLKSDTLLDSHGRARRTASALGVASRCATSSPEGQLIRIRVLLTGSARDVKVIGPAKAQGRCPGALADTPRLSKAWRKVCCRRSRSDSTFAGYGLTFGPVPP